MQAFLVIVFTGFVFYVIALVVAVCIAGMAGQWETEAVMRNALISSIGIGTAVLMTSKILGDIFMQDGWGPVSVMMLSALAATAIAGALFGANRRFSTKASATRR